MKSRFDLSGKRRMTPKKRRAIPDDDKERSVKKVEIGTATLYLGDCMEYMAMLPDKAFDLAIVDPPYGRGEDGWVNRDGTYAKKDWDFSPPPIEYFSELKRVTEHQIIWGANYMPAHLGGGMIVWDKLNDGSDQSDAELAYCSFSDRVDIARFMWRGMLQGDNVGSFSPQGNKSLNEVRIHPTQKPVKLYEWLLTSYAEGAQRILDTHGGSMSSVIACLNLGVEIVCIEKDEDYFNAAVKRITQSQMQRRLFV